ncbi:OsmC family protein [Ornithinibacillus halotolerans]|uniref:Peroxiredoxin n=1 Tax=Ornithinibacillus halotolerans TaxID=1274357 RepID=A0A916S4Z5_9BACI|nr:OsmC family protein [Ornithinibacillus halotolerans]GGA81695.1 peroxiredoxin [Ornithinibacillus halotolerans]
MEMNVKWDGKMAFTGFAPSGHKLKMDAAESVGGENTGARPTELLLSAVAGCTGIDIVSILTKMRHTPTSFQMNIAGDRADDHPKKFTKITIHYAIEGDIPEDKVIRAIELSMDKYCSVSHSLSAEITATYSLNGNTGEKSI